MLTKDFRILAGQKRYFTIIILIALIFLCSGQPAQIIVGYCTMFGMLFTVNTISYDEFDHGYLFLFTLPVTRKDYVLEKYVFMLLCGGGFWAVSALCKKRYSKDCHFTNSAKNRIMVSLKNNILQ